MPRPAKKKSANPASETAPDLNSPVRARILEAFSEKARRSGIRAVVMGELATELRMSAMTLYKYFPSKDELVSAMIDAWAHELAALDALEWDKVQDCKSALEMLARWADAWTASLSNVSPAFFGDLHRDHPVAWKQFQARLDGSKWAVAKYFMPLLRQDISPVACLMMLDRLVTQAADPSFVEQIGISRQESVRIALSIWGGGALKEPTILPVAKPSFPRAITPGFTPPGIKF